MTLIKFLMLCSAEAFGYSLDGTVGIILVTVLTCLLSVR